MFEDLVQWIVSYPYPAVASVFLLCGMGLPIPEELVLIAAGYVCAKWPDKASLHWMMVWCGGAILAGDLLPFVLGRVFGTRLLRLRWLRLLVTKRRLAKFDNWFRRRGDLVIFIARFLAGIRVVAFFTAGTMKMAIGRFLLLDGLGIILIVPLLTWIGSNFAGVIDTAIERVQAVERGLLWSICAGVLIAGIWLWLWRRRRARAQQSPTPTESFVEPQLPVGDGAVPATGAMAAVEADDDPDLATIVDLPDLGEGLEDDERDQRDPEGAPGEHRAAPKDTAKPDDTAAPDEAATLDDEPPGSAEREHR